MTNGDRQENLIGVETKELSPLSVIKTEANLAILPFFALSRQEVKSRIETQYTARVDREGKTLEVLWSVTPNAKYGYPGPFDRKVHKAIEYIINCRGIPVENPIPFSMYQIAKIMGIGQSGGKNYRKIREAIGRVVATTVKSEGTFYSKQKRQYISDIFHLYDRVVFKEQTLPGGELADANYLFLSQWYLDSINAFYVRPIDFDYLQQLRSDVAGRLYELLGLKFHGVIINKRSYWRVEYKELCDLLPTTPQKYVSDAKKCLTPAHKELIETHFLARVVWDTANDQRWFLLYHPGKKAREEIRSKAIQEELPLSLPEPVTTPQDVPELTPEEQELFALLKDRRINSKTAGEMIKARRERIREKVEIFDWIVQNGREKIQNPTGFLRRMIEENWPAPEGFVSEAERQEREEERHRREEELQRQEEARRATETLAEQERQQRREASPWKELWEQIAEKLSQQMSRQSFCTWVQPLFVRELQEHVVVLDCPNRFIKERLEESYHSVIEEAVMVVCGAEKQVIFVCGDSDVH